MTISKAGSSNVRWRTVALPTEHGSWAFVGEPILLGMILAPTWGGLALCIAVFAAFLLRQPLNIYLKDMRHHRRVPRTVIARQFVLIYGGILIVAGGILLFSSPRLNVLLPLVLAVPLFVIQLIADLQNRSRSLTAELASSLAVGAIAPALVLMNGWLLLPAFGLWLALGVKAITAVLYVRARLRLERNRPAYRAWAVISHTVGMALLVIATAFAIVPWTVPVVMTLLLIRATIGLSALRKVRPPKIIGLQEIGYGLGFVLAIAYGYTGGLPITFPTL